MDTEKNKKDNYVKEENQANAIDMRHVTVKLGDTVVLQDITACVPCGSSTAIIGPNGAGKTSLALAILGQEPHTGEILFFGARKRKEVRFGFVPQKLQFDRNTPVTVLDFLLAGLQRRPLFFGYGKAAKKDAEAMLDEVESAFLANRVLGALSGGEMQRVMLAAALLRRPEILIMDEPTSGVDVKGGQLCCELLQKFREKYHFTQIMISHDLATVAAHADHVICLHGRMMAQGRPQEVLTHDVLTKTFGLHLGVPNPNFLAGNPRLCDEHCPHHREHMATSLHDVFECHCHEHAHSHGERNGEGQHHD